MDSSELKKILDDHKLWLEDHDKGKRADLSHMDLRCADLRDVDLSHAVLHSADLCGANLSHADLSHSNLCNADLSHSYLMYANLSHADLCYADLRNTNLGYSNLSHADLWDADLRNADLCGSILHNTYLGPADLDFSCRGLSCKTFDVSVSMRRVYQLCYHICRLKCENEEFTLIKNLLKPFANKFHRVDECGKIE